MGLERNVPPVAHPEHIDSFFRNTEEDGVLYRFVNDGFMAYTGRDGQTYLRTKKNGEPFWKKIPEEDLPEGIKKKEILEL